MSEFPEWVERSIGWASISYKDSLELHKRIRESVFCRCGAQWHGRYTGSEHIAEHQKKCGDLIDGDEFEALGHKIVGAPALTRNY